MKLTLVSHENFSKDFRAIINGPLLIFEGALLYSWSRLAWLNFGAEKAYIPTPSNPQRFQWRESEYDEDLKHFYVIRVVQIGDFVHIHPDQENEEQERGPCIDVEQDLQRKGGALNS